MLISLLTVVISLITGYMLGAGWRRGQIQSLRWENETLTRLLQIRAEVESYNNIKVGGTD